MAAQKTGIERLFAQRAYLHEPMPETCCPREAGEVYTVERRYCGKAVQQ
jgi:hypothetical protein